MSDNQRETEHTEESPVSSRDTVDKEDELSEDDLTGVSGGSNSIPGVLGVFGHMDGDS